MEYHLQAILSQYRHITIMDIFKSFGSDKPNEYLTINEIKQHLMNTIIYK